MHNVLFMGGIVDGRIQVVPQLAETLILESNTDGAGYIYHKKGELGAFTIYQSADAKNNYADSLIDAYVSSRAKPIVPVKSPTCMLHNEVVSILSEHAQLKPHLIVGTTNFTQLGMDSLDRIEALFHLEEHFNIEITKQAAEQAETVYDIVKIIRELR